MDLIEKGECVLAYDIQPCRGTAGPDGEPGIGAGIVRVRVRRHYSDDPGRPRSRVIAAEDEHRERERLHSQLRRLNPRALEEHADLLRIPIDNADDVSKVSNGDMTARNSLVLCCCIGYSDCGYHTPTGVVRKSMG